MNYQINKHYIKLFINNYFHNKTIIELLKYYKQAKKSIHKLRMSHDIYLNDINIKQNLDIKLHKGDILKLPIFLNEEIDFLPQNIPLDIIYEDEFLLIVNKQANIKIHPDTKLGLNTLVNGVAYYYQKTMQNHRIRYINRLDIDTTGLIIFVKNFFVHNLYDYFIKNNKIRRFYKAIVSNKPLKAQGIIEKKISRDRHNSKRFVISKNGVYAKTTYKVLKHYHNYSLLELELFTGKTHQIRVHLKSINCPILGDKLYNNFSHLINRQALHAYKVVIPHPITLKPLSFLAPLPNDMQRIIS